ncbi:MAG: GNAT family N-acetyltransferase [Gemmataceae bacterium]|nr:GNAT family N-acetyltransferase [Gemmataceae bacterium]
MHIRRMNLGDLPAGLRLSEQAGWNQLPESWARQFALEPEGCFVAENDGQVIGTACTCVFDDVAWINLVLVVAAQRGKGIGTRLMLEVLKFLDDRRVPTIRLDATPLGQSIYEKLGFVVEYELTRFAGVLPPAPQTASHVERVTSASVAAVVAFDQEITRTNREKLLRYQLEHQLDSLLCVRAGERIAGFAAFRPGRRAWQIGPCLGESEACLQLLTAVQECVGGNPVFMDVPAQNEAARSRAKAFGLTPQRILTRMSRGRRIEERIDKLWCSFGPEKG